MQIAACRAPHLHIPCIAVAVAAADEIARDARVPAVVDHCAPDADRSLVFAYGVDW